MWIYEKKLEYLIHICKPDPKMSRLLLEMYGGPDGELSQALQYLNQRYSMHNDRVKALLTDIGTEELAHLEIIATMISKLNENVLPEGLESTSQGSRYIQHGSGLFYSDTNGIPWTASYIGTKGDPIADLYTDIAAEEKAGATYQYLINISNDPGVIEALKFLREREIIHSLRFREAVENLKNERE